MRVEIIYRLVTIVIWCFCFPDRTVKGGEYLGFLERGESQKKGDIDLEKGGGRERDV